MPGQDKQMTAQSTHDDTHSPEAKGPDTEGQEQRGENRIAIDSIILPFLGSLASNQATFEYLLHNLSPSGACIMIPRWVVRREHLHRGDNLELHAPFRYHGSFYTKGRVIWTRWDESSDCQVCGITMTEAPPPYYPVFISLQAAKVSIDLQDFDSSGRLLYLLLKDAHLLKRGTLIYLKHLVPFFYRVGEYPSSEYEALKDTILDDIRGRVDAQARLLADHQTVASRDGWRLVDLPRVLDLNIFRSAVESEMQRDLLLTVFQVDTVRFYLDAIQELEKKLYHTFNTLMMLYMQALTKETAATSSSPA